MTNTPLPSEYCLATVTSDSFCIGTEVLLFSFLKYNTWFAGDIVIIIADLSAESRRRLRAIYPVTFLSASEVLVQKTKELVARIERLRDIWLRFYSLEAFNLPDYQRVVYLDSDLHCAGDLRDLFTGEHVIAACLDGFSYEQRARPLVEQAGLSLPVTESRYGKIFETSINSGVLSISPPALDQGDYTAMVAMLDYDVWIDLDGTGFTDQTIINRHFEGRFTILSSRYNYVIFLEEYLKYVDGVGFHEATLIHFAGRIKPWNEYAERDLRKKAARYIKYIEEWRELHAELRHRGDPLYRARRILEQYDFTESGVDRQLPLKGRIS